MRYVPFVSLGGHVLRECSGYQCCSLGLWAVCGGAGRNTSAIVNSLQCSALYIRRPPLGTSGTIFRVAYGLGSLSVWCNRALLVLLVF
ncbi:hypothetical protein BDZ94DRAFT_1248160 [Collybia nuda]|uniref:Uncharacterized protein n=1 Tax=Collybia nuda TaxID=64659 RepID=A0A9P6CN52_9AGAR|nr:hypothetical protein BDZ94DRAFT_1248160 [Collybia nuda]